MDKAEYLNKKRVVSAPNSTEKRRNFLCSPVIVDATAAGEKMVHIQVTVKPRLKTDFGKLVFFAFVELAFHITMKVITDHFTCTRRPLVEENVAVECIHLNTKVPELSDSILTHLRLIQDIFINLPVPINPS